MFPNFFWMRHLKYKTNHSQGVKESDQSPCIQFMSLRKFMSAIKRYQTVYEFQKAHLKTRNRYSGRKDEANDVLFFHSRNFLD